MEETKPVPPLAASIIRTLVPYIIGYLLSILAKTGLNIPSEIISDEVVTLVLGTLYYALARVLETRFKPVWGWLLGLPKQPTYDATAKADPASPTNESAGPASDVAAEGDPVETIPTDAVGEPIPSDPGDPPPPFEDATGPFPEEPDVAVDQTPYADEAPDEAAPEDRGAPGTSGQVP